MPIDFEKAPQPAARQREEEPKRSSSAYILGEASGEATQNKKAGKPRPTNGESDVQKDKAYAA